MIDITTGLENLNANFVNVVNLIPNPNYFTDDFDNDNDDWDNFPLGDVTYIGANGKVYWGGQASSKEINYDFGSGSENYQPDNLIRFNSDGTIDSTFHKPWFYGNDDGYVRDVKEQSTGKIIVVGHFSGVEQLTTSARIARLNSDGTVDDTFVCTNGLDNVALCCWVLNDDSILVGGAFNNYDGTSSPKLVKLNSNGSINSTFASNIASLSINGTVHAIVVDNSGKIYIGGQFSNAIKRLNSDGTEDTGFNVGSGFSNGDGNQPRVSSIAIQNDGKLMVGHWFKDYNGSSCNPYITRLNTDGTVDSSFANQGSGLNYTSGAVQTVAIQSNGKIVVGGYFVMYNGNPQNYLARFETNGNLDGLLDVSNKIYRFSDWGSRVQSVVVDASGNLHLAGDFFSYEGNPCYGYAKINSDGSFIETDKAYSFEPDTLFDDPPLGLKVLKQNDGKVLVCGDSDRYDEANNLRRLNADGTEDTTFKTIYADDIIRAIGIQSTGKIIVGGSFFHLNGIIAKGLARLNTDGTIDDTFNGSGLLSDDAVFALKVMPDDTIWVGGNFNNFDGESNTLRLVRLYANGDFLTGTNYSFDSYVNAIENYDNNNILVGGQFSNKIVMIQSNGDENTSFNVGSGFSNGVGNNPRVSSFAVQNDGKVIVGHWFTEYNGSSCSSGITRLNSNGSFDSSFATDGSGLSASNNRGIVQAVALQSDGKVLVGGWFNTYDGNSQNNLIRLNSNGTKDTSFNIGVGFDETFDNYGDVRVDDILINSDGSLFCAGGFGAYQKYAAWSLIKIQSTGEIDLTFNASCPVKTVGIDDGGGEDMYDGANYLNTNLTQMYEYIVENEMSPFQSIPNTHVSLIDYGTDPEDYPCYDPTKFYSIDYIPNPNGVIKDGKKYFGTGSSYFTNMYHGMFVMVATNVSISEFSVTGNIGSDGSGIDAVSIFPLSSNGVSYTAYLKSNCCAGDPSINQIIIVPGTPDGITQLYDNTGAYDDHCLQGLEGRDQIFYIVVSRDAAEALSQDDASNIAKMFLDVMNGAIVNNYDLKLTASNRNQLGDDGSLDTSLLNGCSIQRTGYIETVNYEGKRKLSELSDCEQFNDAPQTLADVTGIFSAD